MPTASSSSKEFLLLPSCPGLTTVCAFLQAWKPLEHKDGYLHSICY